MRRDVSSAVNHRQLLGTKPLTCLIKKHLKVFDVKELSWEHLFNCTKHGPNPSVSVQLKETVLIGKAGFQVCPLLSFNVEKKLLFY